MFLKKTIHIKLYELKIRFIVVTNISSYLKKLYKKRNFIYTHTPIAGMFESFDMDEYFVVISSKHISQNVLSHEFYHLVRKVARDRNISNEESIAWLMGHISQEIFNFLKSKEISL